MAQIPGRIYSVPVVGTGTGDDPFRAKILDKVGVTRVRAVIASNEEPVVIPDPDNPEKGPAFSERKGAPTFLWTVCFVQATGWGGVVTDPECVLLVNLATGQGLDKVNALPNAADKANFQAHGALSLIEAESLADLRAGIELMIGKHYPGHTMESALLPS